MAVSQSNFQDFVDVYRNFKVPFWIQTRMETITKERLDKLQEVGLFWLSVGIEHGNDEFRKNYVRRPTKRSQMIEVVKHLDSCEQGATLNNIIGYSHETKELAYDTISLNRKFFQLNNRIRPTFTVFTPFRSSEMYTDAVKIGFFQPVPYVGNTDFTPDTLVVSDHFSKETIMGLLRCFPLYVYLPEEYLRNIAVAEKFTEEGNKEFETLSLITHQIMKNLPPPQGNRYFDFSEYTMNVRDANISAATQGGMNMM